MSSEPFAKSRKEERIDVRLHRDAKQLIARAAALTHQSLSDFVLTAVLERSHEVIERSNVLALNEKTAARFLEALADPPAPNPELRRAAERYQRALAEGTLKQTS